MDKKIKEREDRPSLAGLAGAVVIGPLATGGLAYIAFGWMGFGIAATIVALVEGAAILSDDLDSLTGYSEGFGILKTIHEIARGIDRVLHIGQKNESLVATPSRRVATDAPTVSMPAEMMPGERAAAVDKSRESGGMEPGGR